MLTIISWLLLIGQIVAIFFILRNGPIIIVTIIRSLRFKDRIVVWNNPRYTAMIISIIYLLFVGLPKFS